MTAILSALLVGIGVLFGLATGGIWYFSASPGKNFKGELPPLTDTQKAVRDRLKADVEMLATTIGPRDATEFQKALAKAADYIEKEFVAAGFKVTRLPFKIYSVEVVNLEVTLPGTTHPEKVMVVGAHYDSVPETPGADDNATGVAGLLELARRLKDRPAKTTIKLVAFVNEEPPYFKTQHMGSLVYAEGAKARGDKVYGMVSLEMLGYYDTAKGSQKYPRFVSMFYPDTADFIAFVGDTGSRAWTHELIGTFRKVASFPSESISAPAAIPGIDFSDHWSYREIDVPAVMITDTSFFRYDHYHKPTDTPDKLDFDRMARVVDGVIESIHTVANAH